MKINKKGVLNKNVGGIFFLKINKNVVQNKSLQHKQQFYQTLFNVRNQIFINKLLNHQLVDTKTFKIVNWCKKSKDFNKQEVLNKNVGRNFS